MIARYRLEGTLAALALLGLTACGGRGFGEGWMDKEPEQVTTESAAEVEKILLEADEAWLQRVDPAMAEKAATLYMKAADMDPNNYNALAMATHAIYVWADYHIEDKELKMEIYDKGVSYGEKALATDPKFKEMILSGAKVEEAAGSVDKSHMDALYWTASNLGKWAVAKGFVTTLANKNKIKSLIERVAAIDDTYFYGAAHRYLGSYYAKAPSFAGGDLNKSKEHFDRGIAIAPNYLGTHVLKAEFYCTRLQTQEEGGKECFQEALQYVLDTPADVVPDLIPENTLEKRKAEALMPQVAELFAY